MRDGFGNIFNFPENCIVNQRIGKMLFAENGLLTPADRKAFRNDISEIRCTSVLDASRGIQLDSYKDNDHDYSNLVQVDVVLKKTNKTSRITELCHRAIPHPLIVVLHGENVIWISMAEKRFSRDWKDQVVLEDITDTGWLTITHLQEFSEAADFRKFKKSNYLELYRHYSELLDIFKAAEITGTFKLNTLTSDERRRLLEEHHQLQGKLIELNAKAKKEGELSRMVELNTQAHSIRDRMQRICKKLSIASSGNL